MSNYTANSLIAHDPQWRYVDFEQKAHQISAELQQRQVRAIAVWLEDGAKLACTLL